MQFPKKVKVLEVISSRYGEEMPVRPACWEDRLRGVDVVRTTEGDQINLLSEADQSTPHEGWVLMITGQAADAYSWTLYGMPRA